MASATETVNLGLFPTAKSYAPTERLIGTLTTAKQPGFKGESALPATLLFAGLRDPSLRLLKPIPLSVSREEGSVVVSWDEVNEFSWGSSFGDALSDFSTTISCLYRDLNSGMQLGEALLDVREILAKYLESR